LRARRWADKVAVAPKKSISNIGIIGVSLVRGLIGGGAIMPSESTKPKTPADKENIEKTSISHNVNLLNGLLNQENFSRKLTLLNLASLNGSPLISALGLK
jgi:hypothetical protein